MAYTQSALQSELAKQHDAAAGWPWRLMTLSLIVLLTVGAVYGGMKFGFQDAYLTRQLKQADADAAAVLKTVTPDEQRQIFNFYSQLSNIDLLLKKQGKGSAYLDLVEKNTLKAIIYTAMDMKLDDKVVVVKFDGKTSAYGVIVQQLDLYKKMANVKDVKLTGARTASQAADGILFSIQITLNR